MKRVRISALSRADRQHLLTAAIARAADLQASGERRQSGRLCALVEALLPTLAPA